MKSFAAATVSSTEGEAAERVVGEATGGVGGKAA